MKKYLTENITGAASKIEYGKIGDQVEVVKEHGDMYLVKCGNELFHVRAKQLSDDPIETKVETEVVEKVKIQHSKSIKKKPLTKTNQKSLF